jgi:hypothetical protein
MVASPVTYTQPITYYYYDRMQVTVTATIIPFWAMYYGPNTRQTTVDIICQYICVSELFTYIYLRLPETDMGSKTILRK